jgi:fructosamine-3-kinase
VAATLPAWPRYGKQPAVNDVVLWEEIQAALSATLGERVRFSQHSAVGGGCINQAHRVDSNRGPFFVKLNTADGLDMFAAEAAGLEELQQVESLRVPTPLSWGLAAGQAFLVLEFLDLGGPGSQASLGAGLAAMHRINADQFGWYRDNTIGATPQRNTQCSDWCEFWNKWRLGLQLELAGRHGANRQLLERGQHLLASLPALLQGHSPEPSLLHGDLWSGNHAFTRAGEPAIFDPAVYYGDRETDLAMTELFGGFGRDFYAAYRAAWPLDTGYATRKRLYKLYHVLNHFNLFGGAYQLQAQALIDSLLAELG